MRVLIFSNVPVQCGAYNGSQVALRRYLMTIHHRLATIAESNCSAGACSSVSWERKPGIWWNGWSWCPHAVFDWCISWASVVHSARRWSDWLHHSDAGLQFGISRARCLHWWALHPIQASWARHWYSNVSICRRGLSRFGSPSVASRSRFRQSQGTAFVWQSWLPTARSFSHDQKLDSWLKFTI